MNKMAYALAFVALAAVGASIAFIGEPDTAPVAKQLAPAPVQVPAQSPNFRGPGDE